MTSKYSSERVASRLEIEDQIQSFCRGVDRKDWNLVRSVFHDDAVDHHGIYEGDVDGYISFVEERHQRIAMSAHVVGNILIDFFDDDNAVAESYSVGLQSLPRPEPDEISGEPSNNDNETEVMTISRYIDHFTHENGNCRIKERVVVLESAMPVPVYPAATGFRKLVEAGRRDPDDALWRVHKKVREIVG